MGQFFKAQNQIHTMLSLRGAAIIIQLILIFIVSQGLNYQLPLLALFFIVSLEMVFTFVCYFYYKNNKQKTNKSALFMQVLADVFFLSLLLYFSGGATNAFVSLLLIPIAIAAVTLPLWMLVITAVLAVISYSFMLWLMPMHVIHGNMQGHFIGMWVNFLFSTLVVALVVARLARAINKKELAIAKYREEQLKQEKIIALGIASAQVTHQLATPLATAQLLVDELDDEFTDNAVLNELKVQLSRCGQSLHDFRQQTFEIKNQVAKPILINVILRQLQEYTQLNYPDIDLQINFSAQTSGSVVADGALLPAILNLLNNGVRASKANNSNKLLLSVKTNNDHCSLTIRDYGDGFTANKLTRLGIEPVESELGLGMAVFLSHASLERLGGKLSLTNHPDGGALVSLLLPLTTIDLSEKNVK
ncbi:MAG: HAMP domain-containing histidine kinase [Alteromonadaceae bacterium]|nr:HAMP domain-containing histidine kinase [Alteromonadaceae bacterium]